MRRKIIAQRPQWSSKDEDSDDEEVFSPSIPHETLRNDTCKKVQKKD
jgi:hypothetical protein